MNLRENFFSSGWSDFENEEVKNKFQMMNIALVLSSIAVLYGMFINFFMDGNISLGLFELLFFVINLCLFVLLRYDKKYFNLVAIVVTGQYTLLLITLIYVSTPAEMKHVWFFTYPIVMLYTQKMKIFFLWFLFLITMVLLAPLQPFVSIHYTFFELFYLVFVLMIVSIIVYFYKSKMEEANRIIKTQQQKLQAQLTELQRKEKMLTAQSRQAVMGEMISMIAHQWRQPLSALTLQISNLQLKKMLGEELRSDELEEAFEEINTKVLYLSETIDDFQTFFHPKKQIQNVDLLDLVEKSVGFVEGRLKKNHIGVVVQKEGAVDTVVQTHANELVQVFLNIINNAIDAFEERQGGKKEISIELVSKEKEIVVSICDTAGGIPAEDIEAVFEPYYSTKGKNGTGLGLYMSQMIMQKQLQSFIAVENSREGANFLVRVPKKLS